MECRAVGRRSKEVLHCCFRKAITRPTLTTLWILSVFALLLITLLRSVRAFTECMKSAKSCPFQAPKQASRMGCSDTNTWTNRRQSSSDDQPLDLSGRIGLIEWCINKNSGNKAGILKFKTSYQDAIRNCRGRSIIRTNVLNLHKLKVSESIDILVDSYYINRTEPEGMTLKVLVVVLNVKVQQIYVPILRTPYVN